MTSKGKQKLIRFVRLLTHQVLTDSTGADLQEVPQDKQGQGEGQHVELPVPDCHHEHLQAGGWVGGGVVTGHTSERASSLKLWN